MTISDTRRLRLRDATRGLPLGLQIIGRPFDEETLFRTARAIEEAAGPLAKPQDWWSKAA